MPEKHIHKYQRTDIGVKKPYIVHRCVKDCSHYIPLVQKDEEPYWMKSPRAFIIGKKAECWRCGNEFIIQFAHMLMAKPHCSNCIRREKPELSDDIIANILDDSTSELLDDIMGKFR